MPYVARSCTEVSGKETDNDNPQKFQLEELRSLGAYVLLGDPGSGKTAAFKRESEKTGATYISARDFMTLTIRPEWQSNILFIDALDETRAGGLDGRTPLDEIRKRLDQIKPPGFRISCRDADWLGSSDREHLKSVSPTGTISVFRLDPITDEQIEEILTDAAGLSDSNRKNFLKSAREQGLEELLRNLQTLNLLVEVVAKDNWPKSREELFRLACDKLITEPNTEHQSATRQSAPATPALRQAAGYLCALYLIADLKGFSIGEGADSDVVGIREIPGNDLPLQQVLKTRIFSTVDETVFSPVHRSVAEYLGAQFLAESIHDGLPIGRVLALICGVDGGVVSGLRGLHAWLAFHSPESRSRLCELDPLGVILYGASGMFLPIEKQALLSALHRDIEYSASYFHGNWNTRLIGALASSDMVSAFKSILSLPSRAQNDQILMLYALDAIRFGEPLPELGEVLMSAVRDGSRWPHVRARALDALMHAQPSDKQCLVQLARDIRDAKVEDSDDGLLGHLLDRLFPIEIPASEVLGFLHARKHQRLIGGYFMFWNSGLAEKISTEDIPVLLDGLASLPNRWSDHESDLMLKGLVGRLLKRGIENYGDSIPAQQLYLWLSAPIGEFAHSHLDNESKIWIKEWLEARPHRYQELILIAIERRRGEGDMRLGWYKEFSKFCGANPIDMEKFWLQQADKEVDQQQSEFFFERAIGFLLEQSKRTDMSLEDFESWVSARPAFRPALERALAVPEWQKEHEENQKKRTSEEEMEMRERLERLRKELLGVPPELVRSGVLRDLAYAYFGILIGVEGETALHRLSNFVGNDEELMSASLEAFRKSISRTDLPGVSEIVDEATKKRMYFIQPACVAGIEEVYRTSPAVVGALDDEVLASVIAFRLNGGHENEPNWFNHVISNRPEIVARTLVTFASRMLKAGNDHVHGLYELVSKEDYKQIARIALPELLEAFPSRLSKGQATSLDYLLTAALRLVSRAVFTKILEKKLRLRSLDVAQRVYWLACGFLIEPIRYKKELEKYIGKNHERRQRLGAFLDEGQSHRALLDTAPASSLGLLIQLLGPGCSPERPEGSHWVSAAMKTAMFVGSLIDRLSAMANEFAAEELATLAAIEGLSPWRDKLRHAAYAQKVTQREASFRHPSPAQVQETLNKGKPANAADLAALTLDTLRELARETRDGNADSYKEYWNVDNFNRPIRSKPEEGCRDVLLTHLRDRLKVLGIDIQPESRYADSKRTDLRIAYSAPDLSINVPVEIKKDSHSDLWRAIETQLIPRYARDPGTGGHGIYLGLWFGGRDMPNPPKGKKPRTAQELENRLVETLSNEQRALISVVVFDCADRNSGQTVIIQA